MYGIHIPLLFLLIYKAKGLSTSGKLQLHDFPNVDLVRGEARDFKDFKPGDLTVVQYFNKYAHRWENGPEIMNNYACMNDYQQNQKINQVWCAKCGREGFCLVQTIADANTPVTGCIIQVFCNSGSFLGDNGTCIMDKYRPKFYCVCKSDDIMCSPESTLAKHNADVMNLREVKKCIQDYKENIFHEEGFCTPDDDPRMCDDEISEVVGTKLTWVMPFKERGKPLRYKRQRFNVLDVDIKTSQGAPVNEKYKSGIVCLKTRTDRPVFDNNTIGGTPNVCRASSPGDEIGKCEHNNPDFICVEMPRSHHAIAVFGECELPIIRAQIQVMRLKRRKTLEWRKITDIRGKHHDCSDCALVCTPEGVSLIGKSTNLLFAEACDGPACETLPGMGLPMNFTFARELIIKPYKAVAIAFFHNKRTLTFRAECPAVTFCDTIQCYFCLEFIMNYQCINIWWFPICLVILYFIFALILKGKDVVMLFAKFFYLIFKGLRYVVKFIYKCIKSIVLFRWISIISCFLLIVTRVHGCIETSTIEVSSTTCMQSSDGPDVCSLTTDADITMPAQKGDFCLLLKKEGRVVGSIVMTITKASEVCKPKLMYYTRSYTASSASSKRCYGAGSCNGDRCERWPEDSSAEISKHFSMGVSKCERKCGCAGCGCFYCTGGCLFYKYGINPIEPMIYRLDECPSWHYEYDITTRVILNGNEKRYDKIYPVAIPKAVDKEGTIKITISSVSEPSNPLANKRFISSDHEDALVEVSDGTTLIRGQNAQVKCQTREEAAKFETCSYPKNICTCSTGDYRAVCDCQSQDMRTLFSKDRLLPMNTDGTILYKKDGKYFSGLKYTTGITVRVAVKGLKVVSLVDNTECFGSASPVVGCFDCYTGAHTTIKCKTRSGTASGHLICGSQTKGVVNCNDKGEENTIYLRYNSSLVDEKCVVECPRNKFGFRLKGKLVYIHDKITTRDIRNVNDETPPTNFGDVLPELSKFFSYLFSRWYIVVIFVFATIFLILFCCLSSYLRRARYVRKIV